MTDIRKARILVADDDRFHLQVFSDLIDGLGHESLCVENGLEALEKAHKFAPDLIIADVVMPGMDGFELTKRLKNDPLTSTIPVVIVTSLSDRASKVRGLEHGADELLNKPVDEAEFGARVRNLLKVKSFGDRLLEHGRQLEGEVQDKTAQLERALVKIRDGYVETVYRLTLAAEHRDRETGGHIKRISLYSQLLARYLGLGEPEVAAIFFASPMHDVGKIGIPDAILLKKGGHEKDEFEIMKRHTTIGADILSGSDSEILRAAHTIALTHHESWDGTGYPQGLVGERIPIEGRIVNMADIYDALRSKRPYKQAHDHETACRMIRDEAKRFDPVVLKAFTDCADEFKRLYSEVTDAQDAGHTGLVTHPRQARQPG